VDNIKMDLREVRIGSIRLRIGTCGGLMWTRWWTSGFHKMLGSSRVAAQLQASQEGLSSMSEWWVIMRNECFKVWDYSFFPWRCQMYEGQIIVLTRNVT
jgi:hypothetical protein